MQKIAPNKRNNNYMITLGSFMFHMTKQMEPFLLFRRKSPLGSSNYCLATSKFTLLDEPTNYLDLDMCQAREKPNRLSRFINAPHLSPFTA